MRDTLIAIVIILLIGVGGYLFGLQRGKSKAIERVIEITDTLTLRDTIRAEMPVYISKRIVDTMLVAVMDTITIRDTVYVRLDKEQRIFSDDSTYTAWVSGYRPNLDSIEVYRKTDYITNTVTLQRSRLGFGATIGPSVGYGPSGFIAGIALTMGLTYR